MLQQLISIVNVAVSLLIFNNEKLETPIQWPIEIVLTIPDRIELSEPIATTTVNEISKDKNIACSCVRTAIAEGLKIPLKDAKDLKPNGQPIIGGGVLFYYPKTDTHHVAYIKAFTENGFLVKEGNFKPCQFSEREVLWSDKFITGFINA